MGTVCRPPMVAARRPLEGCRRPVASFARRRINLFGRTARRTAQGRKHRTSRGDWRRVLPLSQEPSSHFHALCTYANQLGRRFLYKSRNGS